MDIHTAAPMMIGAWKVPPLGLADRKWASFVEKQAAYYVDTATKIGIRK